MMHRYRAAARREAPPAEAADPDRGRLVAAYAIVLVAGVGAAIGSGGADLVVGLSAVALASAGLIRAIDRARARGFDGVAPPR